jgi:hypothetical protein
MIAPAAPTDDCRTYKNGSTVQVNFKYLANARSWNRYDFNKIDGARTYWGRDV